MKKISKIFAMLVVALVGLSLTACNDGDDLSTDQYGNEISLQSFGPCPVLRGGTLYLYGTNLDQIESVNLPGADPITAYEVLQSGKQSKISIQVPAEKCEPGQIVLKTKKGGEITSISPITYREDIEITKFYVGDNEANMTGNVGDIVTIKGDYLNLMHGIIFEKEDTIKEEDFVAHDRYTIQVAIPVEAKTGVLKLTDLADEPTELETKEALTINTPEPTPIKDVTIKAGEALSLKGTDFDQIASVKFEGAEVAASEFKSQGKQEVVVNIPATATDGTVYVVTKSGVEIPVGNIITVVPTELVATPDPVKNGAELTITGKDMDLITGIAFPNAAESKLNKVETTKVTSTVPEDAQEGDITLSLANGKTVTVAYTLVKPTVTSCTPAAITAGENTIIKGTDLDLVASITFPGDVEQTVEDFKGTANALAVTVPTACVGTGFKLNLKNGTTVEFEDELSIKASTEPALKESEHTGFLGQNCTLTGTNFNNVEALYLGETKVTKITNRTNTEMTFEVPASLAKGTYDIIFITPSGEKLTVGKINAKPEEYDIWSGKVGPTNWSGDKQVNLDAFQSELKAGTKIHFEVERDPSADYWQIEICGTWWTGVQSFYDTYGGGSRVQLDCANIDCVEFTLTQADIDLLNQQNGFLFVGNGVYVTRIFWTKD